MVILSNGIYYALADNQTQVPKKINGEWTSEKKKG